MKSYYHHLQARFVTFVYTEQDYLPVLFDFLREKNPNIYLNPRQEETRKNFIILDDTFVLRSSITEEPQNKHYAEIEKILIDLFIEKDRLTLIDTSEYKRIFENIIFSQRVKIAKLIRYASRREVKSPILKLIH